MIGESTRLIRRSFWLALLFSSRLTTSAAQAPEPAREPCTDWLPNHVSGAVYDRARIETLLGRQAALPEFMRRGSDASRTCRATRLDSVGSGVLLRSAQFHSRGSFSSDYPLDRNNSSMWSGRGLALLLGGGLEWARGPLTLGLLPNFTAQQNRDFIHKPTFIPGYSTFMNTGHTRRIDWPQRFGNDAFATFDAGQSYLRIDIGALAAGISSENLWIGPARISPLLMSNSAPGFFHAFVGARRIHTPVGDIWADLFWGRLEESDYFDQDRSNDWRMLSGIVFSIEPRGAKGLFLGVGRLFASATAGRDIGELLLRPYGLTGEDGTRAIDDNAMLALFARYVITPAQAEVYVEWAHEAGFSGLGDLLREPDHTQAYVFGFQKLVGIGSRHLRAYGELAHLDATNTVRSGRGVVSYYTHGNVPQGHTHRGQLLGAWIGPGSNTQVVGLDLITDRTLFGLFVERTRFDADAYYDQFAKYYGPLGHDLQASVGVRNAIRFGGVQLSLAGSFAVRSNRNFLSLDGSIPGTFERDRNGLLEAEASFYLPRRF